MICANTKVQQEGSLMALIPPTKKVLEVLILKVKAMLSSNGLVEAFDIGTDFLKIVFVFTKVLPFTYCCSGVLKHRNLEGEFVSSQVVPETQQISLDESSNDEERNEENDIDQDKEKKKNNQKKEKEKKKKKNKEKAHSESDMSENDERSEMKNITQQKKKKKKHFHKHKKDSKKHKKHHKKNKKKEKGKEKEHS
jgi:hypothetical protein